MEKIDIEKEGWEIECKKAKGGLPRSLWETYSAFANSLGGIIYLGVEEIAPGTFISAMLTEEEAEKLERDLWPLLNDEEKVSINLLSEEDVSICLYEGHPVLRIIVHPAEREYRPVYINGNPYKGTYRRNHEGDYRCTPDEIKAMVRDASSGSQDLLCLEELGLDVLCEDSVSSYRNRLSAVSPGHVFLKGDRESFLERIGAIRLGKDKEYHPTRAGLLMFGYDYKIVYEYPDYFLDYQEHKEDGPNIRWTDRVISSSGDWSGNLFDFYTNIVGKLTADLPVPFILKGTTRIDDTDLHAAVREALCNAISNSDFYLKGGLVVHKRKDRFEFINPGTMRVSIAQAYKGGESDARNQAILKMFNLVGIGERAGSGIPKIVSASEEMGYRKPEIEESFSPDKVTLSIYLTPSLEKDEKPTKGESLGDRRLTERKKSVSSYLYAHGSSGAKEIAEDMQVSLSTAKKTLYALMDDGLVISEGKMRDKRYSLVSKKDAETVPHP